MKYIENYLHKWFDFIHYCKPTLWQKAAWLVSTLAIIVLISTSVSMSVMLLLSLASLYPITFTTLIITVILLSVATTIYNVGKLK